MLPERMKESADFETILRECVMKGEIELDRIKKELDKSRMICDSLREENDKHREELLLYREATTPPPRIPIPTTSNNPEANQFSSTPPMATQSTFRKQKHTCDTPPTSLTKHSCLRNSPQSPHPVTTPKTPQTPVTPKNSTECY